MPKECLVCPICHGAPEFNEVLGLQCHMKWLHGVNNFSLARPVPQTTVDDHSEGVSDDNDDVRVKEGVVEECWIEEGKAEEGVNDVVAAEEDFTLEVKQALTGVTDAAKESTVITDCETAQTQNGSENDDKTVTVINKTGNDDTRVDQHDEDKEGVDNNEGYDSATATRGEGVRGVSHKYVDDSTAVTSDDSKGVVDSKEIDDSNADTSDCLDSMTESEVQRTHDQTTKKRRGMGRGRRKGSFQQTPSGRSKKQRAVSCSPPKRHAETDASTDDSRKLVSTGGLRTRSGVVLPEIIPAIRVVKVSVEQPMATDDALSDSLFPVRSPRRKPAEGRRRSAVADVSQGGGLRTRSGVVLPEIIPPSRPDAASPKSRVKTRASVRCSADADHVKPCAGKVPVNKGVRDTVLPEGNGGGLRTRSGIVLPERIPPPWCVIAKPDISSPITDVASTDVALPGDCVVPSDGIDALPEHSSFYNGETEHSEAKKLVEECEPRHCMPPKEADVAVENIATSDSCDTEQSTSTDTPEDGDVLPGNPTSEPPAKKQEGHPASSDMLPNDAVLVETCMESAAPRVSESITAAVVAVVPGQMCSVDDTSRCVKESKRRRPKRYNMQSRDDVVVQDDVKRDVPARKRRSHAGVNDNNSKPCSVDKKGKQPNPNKTCSQDIELARPSKNIGNIKSSPSPEDPVTQSDTNDTIAIGSVAVNDTQPAESGSSVSRKRSSPDRLEPSAAARGEPPRKMPHPVTGFLCECQLCGEQYTRRYHLERHMSRTHKKKSTAWFRLGDDTHTIIATNLLWHCVDCGRKFVMARAWHTHMATEHTVLSPTHHGEPVKPESDVPVENAKSTCTEFKAVRGEVGSVKPDFDVATENVKPTSTVVTDVRGSDADAKCSVDNVAKSNTEKCEESSDVGERAADATHPDSLDTVAETTQDAHVAKDNKQFALSSLVSHSSFDISWLKMDTRSPWLTTDRRPVPNSSLPWLSEQPPKPQRNVYVGKRSKQIPGLGVKSSSDVASSLDLSDNAVTEQSLVSQPLNDGTEQSLERPIDCSSATRKEKSSERSLSKERCSGILLSHRITSQTERIRRIRRSSETLSLSSDTCTAKVGIRRSSTEEETKSPTRRLSELHENKTKSPTRRLSESHENKTKSPTRRLSETHEKKTKSPTRRLSETHEKKTTSPTRRLSESQDISSSTVAAKLATPRRPSTEQRLSRTGSPQTLANCKTSKPRSVSGDADQRKDHSNKMSSTETRTVQSTTPSDSSTCEIKPRNRHLSGLRASSSSSSVDTTKLRRESRPPKHESFESHAETKVCHRRTTDERDASADAAVKSLAPSSPHATGACVSASRHIGSLNKSVCPRRRSSATCATSQKVKGVSFGEALQSVSPHRTRSIPTTNASQHKHKSKALVPLEIRVPNTSSDDTHAKRRTTLHVQNVHAPGARTYKNTTVNRLSPQKRSYKSTSRHGIWRAHRSSDISCSSSAKSTTRTKSSSKLPEDRHTAPSIKSSESHEHNTTYNKIDKSSHLTSHGVVREKTYLQSSMASHPDKVLRGEDNSHRGNSSKRGSRHSPHTLKRKETKPSHLKRSASEYACCLKRTSALSQSASVKSAKRDVTTTKASAPPTDSRTRNAEACKTVPQHSSAKRNDTDAKEKTRSDASELYVGGRMSKRRRTLPDLFGVPLNSSYIT